MTEQTLILWICLTVLSAFAAGCSIGATHASRKAVTKKGTANARRS
jgi:hypothetical protein